MCENCNSKTWNGEWNNNHIIDLKMKIEELKGTTNFFQPKDGDITMNGNGESLIYRNYEWHKYS